MDVVPEQHIIFSYEPTFNANSQCACQQCQLSTCSVHIAASVTFALGNHCQPTVSATSAQPGLTSHSSSAWQRSLCSVYVLQVLLFSAAVQSVETGKAEWLALVVFNASNVASCVLSGEISLTSLYAMLQF